MGENMFWATLILAASVPLVVFLGYLNRRGAGGAEAKGIGWQFIRYTVLAISLPLTAMLALNGLLTGEAATLIAGAMGFAFGKAPKDE